MHLEFESANHNDYLTEIPPFIVWHTPLIQECIATIITEANDNTMRAAKAFTVARDTIHHSFDTGNPLVTIGAEEVLREQAGICFAKSHLLVSLLRGMQIPAGFCYQRVLRKGTVESGYGLHGLVAVYLDSIGWFRVDPRGNKPGIQSEFTFRREQLAYPIRTELGEVDYPTVFVAPYPSVITAMMHSTSSQELYFNRPEELE